MHQPCLIDLVPIVACFVAAAHCGSGEEATAPGSNDASSATVVTGAGGTNDSNTSQGGSNSTTQGTAGTGGASTSSTQTGPIQSDGFTTVFTILLENHDYNEVVGNTKDTQYMNKLIAQHGLATNYFDSGYHPSLPNYLYLIAGDQPYSSLCKHLPLLPQNHCVDADPQTGALLKLHPAFPVDIDNLGHQLEVAGIAWRSYQEGMGTACNLAANDAGHYAPKHDPFLYFTNIQEGPDLLCEKRNVDYAKFDSDLASGKYRYMWITPNLINDGHDPAGSPDVALKQSDDWLSVEVPKILQSDVYKKGGIIFITWDEAEGRNGNNGDQIPMIVISPKLKSAGFKSATLLSHASYLATIEEIFALPKLGDAQTATTLTEFFE